MKIGIHTMNPTIKSYRNVFQANKTQKQEDDQ